MKKITVIACLLALLTLSACGAQTLPADEGDVPPVEGISQTQEDGQTGTKVVYIPMWMQDYSVVYYDGELNRTIAQGGELTEEEIAGREDIDPEQMYGYYIAEPNTKVEYDLHGCIQNIYYLNDDGEYQLEKPHDMVG